jgi:hypothetical protein
MSLRDLVVGLASPGAEPGASGLASLVRPAEARPVDFVPRMSLPAALKARDRGEVAVPVGVTDGLAGMVVAELPRPAPAPTADWRDDEVFVEARTQQMIDRREMQARVAARRQSSRDARVTQRLDDAAQQLEISDG